MLYTHYIYKYLLFRWISLDNIGHGHYLVWSPPIQIRKEGRVWAPIFRKNNLRCRIFGVLPPCGPLSRSNKYVLVNKTRRFMPTVTAWLLMRQWFLIVNHVSTKSTVRRNEVEILCKRDHPVSSVELGRFPKYIDTVCPKKTYLMSLSSICCRLRMETTPFWRTRTQLKTRWFPGRSFAWSVRGCHGVFGFCRRLILATPTLGWQAVTTFCLRSLADSPQLCG